MSIVQKLEKQLQVNCSIGIDSGDVYCGALGSTFAREYGVISDVVNVASRLMKAVIPSKQPRIYCSAAVMKEARLSPCVCFTALGPIPLKGKKDPLPVYSPQSRDFSALTSDLMFWKNLQVFSDPNSLAEIDVEMTRPSQIDELLVALLGERNSVTLIVGEKGMGKELASLCLQT